MASPRTSTAPTFYPSANPPKARTPEERAARAEHDRRRHEERLRRREEERRREARTDRLRPAGALAAKRRARERTPEEEARQADARDRLHAALDALADRAPTDPEARDLLAVASRAFPAWTAGGRLLAALVRHPALSRVLDGGRV